MYEFVDTIESAKNTPLSLQTIFNGNNLDKLLSDENGRFTTTSVGGRGPIAKRLITKELPGTHGEKEKDYTFEARPIPVEFLIEDKTSEGLRERVNKLNGYISGQKKVLSFTDEKAHFISTLESADFPNEDSNSFVGTLNFIRSEEHTSELQSRGHLVCR